MQTQTHTDTLHCCADQKTNKKEWKSEWGAKQKQRARESERDAIVIKEMREEKEKYDKRKVESMFSGRSQSIIPNKYTKTWAMCACARSVFDEVLCDTTSATTTATTTFTSWFLDLLLSSYQEPSTQKELHRRDGTRNKRAQTHTHTIIIALPKAISIRRQHNIT